MLKEYMWNIFKTTGNIGSYILYKEISKEEECLFSSTSSSYKHQME